MALVYPRFVVNEFAPAFRLFDELQSASRRGLCGPRFQSKARPFNPRFDVTENKDGYELKGELPGVAPKNIEVLFTDEKTLTIKGHTESHREEGTRPTTAQVESQTEEAKATESQTEQAPVPVSDENETSSSYHKASVEDEYVDVSESEATMSGANPDATPAKTPKEAAAEKQEAAAAVAPAQTDGRKYWLTERSQGRFSRSWEFPKNVQQDQVTASLKDGILSIVVPKAPVPENRRVEIQ